MNGTTSFPENIIRYHDFAPRGYEVRDYGGSIILDLYRKGPPDQYSRLKFQDVESHSFTHTDSACITDIMETPFMEALKELGLDFRARLSQIGGSSGHLRTNGEIGDYFASQGFKTWVISSAIGFEGMVVARSLISIDPGIEGQGVEPR